MAFSKRGVRQRNIDRALMMSAVQNKQSQKKDRAQSSPKVGRSGGQEIRFPFTGKRMCQRTFKEQRHSAVKVLWKE